MKIRFFGLVAGIAMGSTAAWAGDEPQVLGKMMDTLKLEQIPASNGEVASSGQLDPGLIGGEVVDRSEYPGVFYTRQGSSRCTGTLVGSRVVATAAHCVSNNGQLALTYEGETYSGRCTHHSEYRGNSTADWALCLLSESIDADIAESVNTDGSRLSVNDDLILMGFGCIYNGGGGGNDGSLRVGSAPIIRLPTGTNYDIVTRGSSALCYGDSGGPSFVIDQETGKRYQTAINSRGNIRTTSYLSSLHTSSVQEFYREFANRNNVGICGIHDDATGCRQPAQPRPEVCETSEADLELVKECTYFGNDQTLAQCDEAMGRVRDCVTAIFAEES